MEMKLKLTKHQYRWTSLYSRDRDSKNGLKYNKFAYKKTKDDCKLEDRFQKKGHFWIAYMYSKSQIKRPHITRAACTCTYDVE